MKSYIKFRNFTAEYKITFTDALACSFMHYVFTLQRFVNSTDLSTSNPSDCKLTLKNYSRLISAIMYKERITAK